MKARFGGPHAIMTGLFFGKELLYDDFVKSPSAALRFTFVVAAYLVSTPHSLGFARLAYRAFYFVIPILTFYETIIV
ncbi:MAG: hypothetical protein OEW45_14080 [Deltaproteobacteria bacterium]|jgi:hypothetical protein|nr:hypothetical protein [Deltaproteobacteria bacterium]